MNTIVLIVGSTGDCYFTNKCSGLTTGTANCSLAMLLKLDSQHEFQLFRTIQDLINSTFLSPPHVLHQEQCNYISAGNWGADRIQEASNQKRRGPSFDNKLHTRATLHASNAPPPNNIPEVRMQTISSAFGLLNYRHTHTHAF